nr:hypothetical protein [Tanacetum cinerariifolium]
MEESQFNTFKGYKLRVLLTIPQNLAFQIEDLDAYDSNCDDISSAKATLILEEESRSKMLDTFNTFDKTLLDEITEVQTVFNQMEAAVDQCSIDKNAFEIQIKQIRIDNDQLLKQIMSQEIVYIAMNSVDILTVNKSCVDECNKCLKLETELLKKKDLIEKDTIPQNLAFQIEDLDAYDSDCDDISSAKAVLMENHSSCDSDVLFETLILEEESRSKMLDTFNTFDKTLLDEITEVQTVFNQMEAAVDQCSIDKNAFEIQIKQIRIDNDQLLKQIMSQEIVYIAMNSVDILTVNKSESLSIHISLSLLIHNKKWINNIPPLPKYQSWIQENSSNGSSGYNNIFNMSIMPYGRAPRSQERGRRDNYRQGSKAEEQAPKALMAIDGVGWDWSYMANDEEDHALVADEVAPTEFALMANTSAKSKTLKEEKEGVDGKLAGLLTASKDLYNLIESQRPSPTVKSTSGDDQNKNPSVSETIASPITPKPFINFVKPKDSQLKSKTGKTESPKKPPVKYAKQYRKPNKKPNVRGNQRNWNNLKSHQLGPDFVMKKKACFNYGDYNHLAYDCRKRVKKSFTPKPVVHRPYKPSQRPVRTNMNGARPNRTSFNKHAHSYANRPFHRTSVVRSYYRAPWVLTVSRSFPPVNKKLFTGSRNFPTANRKFPTTSRKFPTGSTKCSTADMRMKRKAVKPSACWFWKPSQNLSNKGPNNNSVSVMFKKYTYIDTQGRLKSVMAWVPKEN